jgi:oxygen-dependent protoporphyrinogen oxidase
VTDRRRVVVVGAGIAGLAAALDLARTGGDVVVVERSARIAGRIASDRFAGVDHVDAGADAFLARVPDAVGLANDVGLGGDLVSPEAVGAAVWQDGLHPIPDGLVLGLPGRLGPLARTGLLTWRGKARAALEPLLPRTSTTPDSIGAFVRARFGDEVHERLVDSLVGSIYAADTDRFSLQEVPQLASIAERHRSLLLGARTQRRTAGTATAAASPVFAAPRTGMATLPDATAAAVEDAGGEIRRSSPVTRVEPGTDGGFVVRFDHGDPLEADAVIVATPATTAAELLGPVAPDASKLLARGETADVIMVRLHVPPEQWPSRLVGLSGYLVPKPAQRWVTAASFGSQKWAHWRPPDGGELLRVSIGRDGMPVLHLDDDEVVAAVLTDLETHLGVEFSPTEVDITRWPAAFAQYRPHHARWVDAIEAALPAGLHVTGAAYRGIGIPACIRQARATAARACEPAGDLTDLRR